MKHTTICNTPKTRSVTPFFKNISPQKTRAKSPNSESAGRPKNEKDPGRYFALGRGLRIFPDDLVGQTAKSSNDRNRLLFLANQPKITETLERALISEFIATFTSRLRVNYPQARSS